MLTMIFLSLPLIDPLPGKESTLGENKAYVTGSNKDVAVLMIHDVFGMKYLPSLKAIHSYIIIGWTLDNARLLADHYAKEVDATVYLPD